jgi:fumarylacetoacetase
VALAGYGVFSAAGEPARVGARRGEEVLDLGAAAPPPQRALLESPSLNPLMAAGPEAWAAVAAIEDAPAHALAAVELHLPFAVADYVDFYSSLHHATNAGRMFRPGGDPLPPNWRHLPIGYHGRAGTVVPSGSAIVRPHGQLGPGEYGATRRLDVELELGFVIGAPSRRGEPVPIERALDHVFGVVLLNDWSARDIQGWETVPLGPFLGKSFATSIGHWVVPVDALDRTAREPQDPTPLAYLREEPWAFDIALELDICGTVVARTNARELYWSAAQQIAHLTVNGASLRTGDLLGSGTISGPGRHERGSLLELSWNGTEPLALDDGSTRTFLEDGDEVVLRGDGLGEVRGRIEPALA